jgi:multiple sugar transport system substrate-binding protein
MKSSQLRRISFTIATVVLLIASIGSTRAQSARTKIVWFVDAPQDDITAVLKTVVERFNASQDEIDLELFASCCALTSKERLRTLLTHGVQIDLIGPAGRIGGDFHEESLNLRPLIEKYKADLKAYPDNLINLGEEAGKQVGFPIALWPSVMFYNVEMFDRAGLAYPPTRPGEKYTLNSKKVDWDWNTAAEIAKRLTLDINGNNAKSSKFDPNNVVQHGYAPFWTLVDSDFSTFGDAPLWNPTTRKISIPPQWRERARWTFNGIWKEYFIPSANSYPSGALKYQGNFFTSGVVAMSSEPIWYSGIIFADSGVKWDLGVVPAHKGQHYSPTSVDTLRIMETTQQPDAAFKVLRYLVGRNELLNLFQYHPARVDPSTPLFALLAERHPFVKNWDVISSTLQSARLTVDQPYFPNRVLGADLFRTFREILHSNLSINVDEELDKFQAHLQKIVDEPVHK